MIKTWFLILIVALGITTLHTPIEAKDPTTLWPTWNDQGNQIAITDGTELVIYGGDLTPQQQISVFEGDTRVNREKLSLVWSPNGQRIAVSGLENSNQGRFFIQLWDLVSGKELALIHTSFPPAFSAPDQILIPTVFWLPDNEHISILQNNNQDIYIYHVDGTLVDRRDFFEQYIVATSDDPNDPDIGQTATRLQVVSYVKWIPRSEDFMISVGYGVFKWNMESDSWISQAGCTCNPVISPSGKWAAGYSYTWLHVWSSETFSYQLLLSIPDATDSTIVGWRNNHEVWTLDRGGTNTFRLWRFKVNKPIKTFDINEPSAIGISPDGTRLLVGDGKNLLIKDIESGNILASRSFAEDDVFSLKGWPYFFVQG